MRKIIIFGLLGFLIIFTIFSWKYFSFQIHLLLNGISYSCELDKKYFLKLSLSINDTKFNDASILRSAPLSFLSLRGSSVTDISFLKDLNLARCDFSDTEINDISPLKNMKLISILLKNTLISDLTPLSNMPLTSINLENTHVSDLSALIGCPLEYLEVGKDVYKIDTKNNKRIYQLYKDTKQIKNGVKEICSLSTIININTVKPQVFLERHNTGFYNNNNDSQISECRNKTDSYLEHCIFLASSSAQWIVIHDISVFPPKKYKILPGQTINGITYNSYFPGKTTNNSNYPKANINGFSIQAIETNEDKFLLTKDNVSKEYSLGYWRPIN